MQTIAHYNLLERLGTGALGEVYRARDLKYGRTVALMMPPPELIAGAGRREKFLEQARAAQMLNHPNIATLFDVVERGRPVLSRLRVCRRTLAARRDGGPIGQPAPRDRAGGADQRCARRGAFARPHPRRFASRQHRHHAEGQPEDPQLRVDRLDDERTGPSRGRFARRAGHRSGTAWPATCRPNRRSAARSTSGATCFRSACCCRRCSPGRIRSPVRCRRRP